MGGGIFVSHRFLPLPLAWQAFGEKNGVPDFDTFERMILEHRSPDELGKQIGCTVLVELFFWPRDAWIPVPSDWSKNIITGKSYAVEDSIGAALWADVRTRLCAGASTALTENAPQPAERYGAPQTIRPRLGQGAFRVEVTDAYCRRCAITGGKLSLPWKPGTFSPMRRAAPMKFETGCYCAPTSIIFSTLATSP